MSLEAIFTGAWQKRGFLSLLLLPLGLLYAGLMALRRTLYRIGIFESERLPCPVVVVGNVTVGGSGKTPLTLWLVSELKKRGRSPGIISRGHGGSASGAGEIREVRPDDAADRVGDEPLLMARRGLCPVWIGRNRAAAGRGLLAAHPEVDVLISDDGLQHYRLARDVEVVVMDRRGAGNGFPLPAGPLREPVSRAFESDVLVLNGCPAGLPIVVPTDHPTCAMSLRGSCFRNLKDPTQTRSADNFKGMRIHALAGIGDPRRFFDLLAGMGLEVCCHGFPDHHAFRPDDLVFPGAEALLMTEKDGVKCAPFAPAHAWVLAVDAEIDATLAQLVSEKLNGRPPA